MTNMVDDAANRLDRAAGTAREKIGEVADQASRTVRGVAEGQREKGADAIETMARAVHAAAQELGAASPTVGRYVDDAAGGLVRASQAMRDRSAPELLRQTAELARRQPLIAFASAVLAGIAMSRFLKSSAAAGQNGTDAAQAGGMGVGSGFGASPYGGDDGRDGMSSSSPARPAHSPQRDRGAPTAGEA